LITIQIKMMMIVLIQKMFKMKERVHPIKINKKRN
jgi:hypothetical protein